MTDFKVGDKGVYPGQGVVDVTGIEKKTVLDYTHKFYILIVQGTAKKIMVPVDNAAACGLRPVATKREADDIFELLREKSYVKRRREPWNRRHRAFMDRIRTGELEDAVLVLREIYRDKANNQELSLGEKRMAERAARIITPELAIARDQTEEEVTRDILAVFFKRKKST